MQNFIKFKVIITELCSVLYSINILNPSCDVTTCAESAIYILQFLQITSELKEIVYHSKRSIGLFFHALSHKTITKLVAILLPLPFKLSIYFGASLAKYTARNAQVAASLLQACYHAVIKTTSGCVRIACSGLMMTSVLQAVNRLAADWLARIFIHKLDAGCFNNLRQVCIIKLQVWFSQTCCNVMNSTDLLQLVDNLHQAGKILNLQQVCGVSGCVVTPLVVYLKCIWHEIFYPLVGKIF